MWWISGNQWKDLTSLTFLLFKPTFNNIQSSYVHKWCFILELWHTCVLPLMWLKSHNFLFPAFLHFLFHLPIISSPSLAPSPMLSPFIFHRDYMTLAIQNFPHKIETCCMLSHYSMLLSHGSMALITDSCRLPKRSALSAGEAMSSFILQQGQPVA